MKCAVYVAAQADRKRLKGKSKCIMISIDHVRKSKEQ